MDKATVLEVLQGAGVGILSETRLGNDLGDQLRLSNGCIVNCYDKGTVNCQGKNIEEIKALLDSKAAETTQPKNKKVFVVYGHDLIARTQLEAMLRRWDLEPIILDQQVSTGQTIIEKLEEYITQVDFGIVLATPDDIGYPKNDDSKKKLRVRQNVILELGMLLSRLGRSRVAILLKAIPDMEPPSDIQGLIYIPFNENVEEAKVSLAKEMQGNRYFIDIKNL